MELYNYCFSSGRRLVKTTTAVTIRATIVGIEDTLSLSVLLTFCLIDERQLVALQ